MAMTRLCEHQDAALAAAIFEARMIGRDLGLKEAARSRLQMTTVASIDATPEQEIEFLREFTRFWLVSDGRRCPECGHRATGPLTKAPRELRAKWRRAVREYERQGGV